MKQSTNSSNTHINVEQSSTLNRRYVKKPSAYTDYSDQPTTASQLQAEALRRRQARAAQINRQRLQKMNQHSVDTQPQQSKAQRQMKQQAQMQMQMQQQMQMQMQQQQMPQMRQMQMQQQQMPQQMPQMQQQSADPSAILRAQAAKNRATDTALQSAALQSVATDQQSSQQSTGSQKGLFKKKQKSISKQNKGRFALALAAATACVIALGLLVKFNMPDLSVRVAALQTGIEATYPSYIPNGFHLTGVSTNKNSSITMDFTGANNATFRLSEEKSSWDSNALLNNYVKDAWGTDYIVIREQGITIYLSDSDATWVNGGLLYHLSSPSADALTKKDIKNIVTSL